jgi:putative PIN family toxin of toxin-antitoxin system
VSILVVLDTNVVVSAGIQPAGNPGRIIDAALAEAIVPVTCPAISTEYFEVVNRARFRKRKFPPVWLNALLLHAHNVDQDIQPWPVAGPDPDDLIFLEVAHLTGAVLVTGNLADFPVHIRRGVTVMDPATFIRHIEELGVNW